MQEDEKSPQSYFERFKPDYTTGLTAQQVEKRRADGLENHSGQVRTRSVGRIIRDNLVTPFNILNLILGVLVFSVGSYKNMLFLGVAICNILIGSIQEIRAKKTIDKLSLIAAPKAHVVRDGVSLEVPIESLVLDDVTKLAAGGQICADAVVLEGHCEVNESLITGESDPVYKSPGDALLSGSFVVSGSCHARVEHVGAENYANKITDSAKQFKKPNSEIMTCINKIIKYIGFALIPIGIALFYKQIAVSGQPFDRAIVSTVAALIGMIPEGLVLLTSMVLAVSVLRLSTHKALVQELYSIETLARVDVLCLDKTGTITEGCMQVDGCAPLNGMEESQVWEILGALTTALDDDNPTFAALRGHCKAPQSWPATDTLPFSSAKKWSGAAFGEKGSYVLGAAEFVLRERFEEVRGQVEQASAQGQRVLLLAHSQQPFEGRELPAGLEPLSLVFLSDKLRDSAPQTLSYFAEQGVDLKVISGDNAITVANIAKRAGLAQADNFVDATTLTTPEAVQAAAEKYAVFGRVTPAQKLELVKALKAKGHTVAMTGDGVNDVLALRESDCSVAMASGSDAARNVSQLVLLDSNFASMPKVVKEGRRSINNLQRSASLFLVKSIFSFILAFAFIFITSDYPFQPIQMTLISSLTIGAPSFILALEPNKERIRGSFLWNVLQKALPGALTMIANIFILVAVAVPLGLHREQLSTMAVLLTGFTGLFVLFKICLPFDALRAALMTAMTAGFVLAIMLMKPLFSLVPFTLEMVYTLIPMLIFAALLFALLAHLLDRALSRHRQKSK